MPKDTTPNGESEQPARMLPPPVNRHQRYKRRKLAAELGVPIDKIPDRRGRHKNHAKASSHPKWNSDKIISEHGYAKIRVGTNHPLADPNGYAYEHLLVWISAGKTAPGKGELIHHIDEDKTNNRISNLELKSRSGHAILHNLTRPRDEQTGQFLAKDESDHAH